MSIAQTITLSNGQIVAVPEGADPKAFRKYAEAKLQQKSSPKKRSPRRRRSSGKTRKTFRAAQVLSGAEIQTRDRGRAVAEQLDRINSTEESTELDGVQPDPEGGFVVRIDGKEIAWMDDTPSAWQVYHNAATEIPWTFGGQTIWLKV